MCLKETRKGSEIVAQSHTALRGPDRVESGSLFSPCPVKTAERCVVKWSRLISDRTPTSHQRQSHQLLVRPGLAKCTYTNKQHLDMHRYYFHFMLANVNIISINYATRSIMGKKGRVSTLGTYSHGGEKILNKRPLLMMGTIKSDLFAFSIAVLSLYNT